MDAGTKGTCGTEEAGDLQGRGYLSLRRLTVYSSLSTRTLRSYLVHPSRPLPHYRVGAKILVRRSDFDEWMKGFKVTDSTNVDQLVSETLNGF